MSKLLTSEDFAEETKNRILDAYCRIDVVTHDGKEDSEAFKIYDVVIYEKFESFLDNSSNYIEYVQIVRMEDVSRLKTALFCILHSLTYIDKKVMVGVPTNYFADALSILQTHAEYMIQTIDLISDLHNDNGVIITINDQRHKNKGLNYVKVFIDGRIKVIIEKMDEYDFDIFYFELEESKLKALLEYAELEIHRRIYCEPYFLVDDRCYLDAFCLNYKISWLGIKEVESGVDLYDYFTNKPKNKIIQEIFAMFRALEKD